MSQSSSNSQSHTTPTDENVRVPNVYIISLPFRKDRRDKMKKRMEYQNIDNYIFVDALKPEDPEVVFLGQGIDANSTRLDPRLNCSRGREHACFASHLKAIKMIIETQDSGGGVIIEDDALLHKDFKKILHTNTPLWEKSNVPLVMLYVETSANEQLINRGVEPKGLFPINNNWGTVGYWISKDYAKRSYERFHVPFININFQCRTSECITMMSGGKFILPQLCLEDPINMSNIRDSRVNYMGLLHKLKFGSLLKWDDFISCEDTNYKNLFTSYFNILVNGDPNKILEQMNNVKIEELDIEQRYIAYSILFKIYKYMSDNNVKMDDIVFIDKLKDVKNRLEKLCSENPAHFLWIKNNESNK